MKVAMVSEHASPLAVLGGVDAGGQNVHVAALARALAQRGNEVVVYTRRDSPMLPDRVRLCPGVTVEHVTAGPARHIAKDDLLPHVAALADELADRLADNRPTVVHAHFWMSGLAALQAARRVPLPVVQTFHALGTVKRRFQGADDTSPSSRVDTERRISWEADRIIATCTDEVRELVTMGARRANIDVVPCGVDTTQFQPTGPAAPRPARPRLLNFGRLVPRKGVDDAITAMQWLPDAELIIAGGPVHAQLMGDPEAVRLKELATRLGVQSRVHLIGRLEHDELPTLIRSADLVITLPWYEPFGIVPLEAMACGVPVIGTAVGGLLDTVIDGRTGALIPPHSPRLAASVAGDLLWDPERRQAYGRAGVARVAEKYRWSVVARATERSYVRALMAHSQRRVARAGVAG